MKKRVVQQTAKAGISSQWLTWCEQNFEFREESSRLDLQRSQESTHFGLVVLVVHVLLVSVLVCERDQWDDLWPHQRPLCQHLGHHLAAEIRHAVSGGKQGGGVNNFDLLIYWLTKTWATKRRLRKAILNILLSKLQHNNHLQACCFDFSVPRWLPHLFSKISSVRCSSSLLLFSLLLIISRIVTARLKSLRSFSIFS